MYVLREKVQSPHPDIVQYYFVYFEQPQKGPWGDCTFDGLAFYVKPEAWEKLSKVRLQPGEGPVFVKIEFE